MKWRENIAMKALAFIAAVAAFTATAIMGWYQLANFNALWDAGYSGGYSYTRRYLIQQDYPSVRSLVNLKEREAAGAELTYGEKRSLEQLEAEFDPGATNLRWQLLDEDGKFIYGNSPEGSLPAEADYWDQYTRRTGEEPGVSINIDWEYWDDIPWRAALNYAEYDGECCDDLWQAGLRGLVEMARTYAEEAVPQDGAVQQYRVVEDFDSIEVTENTVLADDSGYTCVLRVEAPEGMYIYAPTIRACLEANQFGYIFDVGSLTWELTPEAAEAAKEAEAAATETFNLFLWVDDELRVDDQYRRAAVRLEEWQADREGYLAATIVLGVVGLLLMAYLCCGAGRKSGVEGIYLNWFHRLPGDVLLFVMFLGGVAAVGIGIDVTLRGYMYRPMYIQLLCIGVAVATAAALGIGALITVCARCKARTLLRNTWTWAVCGWCWRVFVRFWCWLCELFGTMGRAIQAVPLVWKAVLGCMAYTLFSIVTMEYGAGLWLLVTFVASVYLCGWAYQWKKIRHGTQEIIGGNPNYHIDTRHMLPDLRGHADELNNLGHAISAAVDDRLKSEHFKAELITNVSHDLKTPLTSIINYVDLLKKEDIDNPKAAEYIEVLDRKSQRLKKLTEDLVEASKASTGNLTVNWERLDWAQLIDQALGETGERLEAQKLTVVRSLPEEPLWVEADGRHLWRVLDNLLTNCAKYALPGTRVYVDLRVSGGWAVLSVKNISREALDIPAERLMERFVRGDESRNQAGSGLGLSIAQSLTELQHGRFEINIDGDLFKAIVTLPLAGNRPQDPIQLIL
ncbi:MAG: HAMP domain-containing histidine kinase [Oscillospiraceae bacterium]|nr:HAMP domain-containing histidine kinase [Oscillospiraceae bacterium]